MEKLTNQTIRHILKDIHGDIKEIKTQVKTTNSRVNHLEIWRARIAGAIVIIGFVLIPLIGQLVAKVVNAYF